MKDKTVKLYECETCGRLFPEEEMDEGICTECALMEKCMRCGETCNPDDIMNGICINCAESEDYDS
jgi:DNA-directed RNA polymerase subunit RPC12/RpoP